MASPDGGAGPPRPPLACRLTSRQRLVIDCVVAAAALPWTLYSAGSEGGLGHHAPAALLTVLAMAGTAPVAVRRVWAVQVLAVVTAAATELTALGRSPLTLDAVIAWRPTWSPFAAGGGLR